MRERNITAVEGLIAEGLELYGRNEVADAVRRWREVLVLAPDEPRALDYLGCAGVEPPLSSRLPPSLQPSELRPVEQVASTAVNREVIIELLRARRYEEALSWLRTELGKRPGDGEIGRSVGVLEAHLAARHERELGDLDRVVCVQASPAVLRGLAPDHRRLIDLVDGTTSLREVLVRTELGAYEARRVLALFVRKAFVGPVREARRRTSYPPAPPSASPSPEAPKKAAPLGRRWAAPDADAGAELFKRATEAYLHRDYPAAIALYEQCVEANPHHPSAAHNLARLRSRVGG